MTSQGKKPSFLTRLQKIYLYQDVGQERIDYLKLRGWLEGLLRHKVLVELRRDLFSFHLSNLSLKTRNRKIEKLASELARIRVRNPETRGFPEKALPLEIDYEMRNLNARKGPLVSRAGTPACPRKSAVIYDAYELMKILAELIPKKEKGLAFLHLIITEQMIASYEPKDRYHLRSAYFGYPCLISTTGLVEAPAKPKEFYLKIASGIPKEIAEAELGERILHRRDPRLTQVLKGFILQAIFYQVVGFPHCEKRGCLLYNAHWQEELIRSQLKGKLCPGHQGILNCYLESL